MVPRPQSTGHTKCRQGVKNKFGAATTGPLKTVKIVVAPPLSTTTAAAAAAGTAPSVVQVNCTKKIGTTEQLGEWTIVNTTVNVSVNVNTVNLKTNRNLVQTQMKHKVDAPTTINTTMKNACGTSTNQLKQVVVTGTGVPQNDNKMNCFFALAGSNNTIRGCGKKRFGPLHTAKIQRSPKHVMHALYHHDRLEEEQEDRGLKGEFEQEKEEDVFDCKSESDYDESNRFHGEDRLSRSSSISEFTKDCFGKEGEDKHEDEDEEQNLRILELEDAITRTAERCASLQKKIDATNRANDFLRRSTQAAGRV